MDSCASRVLDNMHKDGFLGTLNRFGQIYDSDESMDSQIGSESGSKKKEHYHNG